MQPAPSRPPGIATGIALLLPCTSAVMGILLLVPVAPQMMAAFAHVPGVEFLVPVLLTLPGLCIALFSPVAGMLADRFGRKRLLIIAMLLYGLAGMAPMLLTDIGPILASRVAVGLCEAVIMTLSTTLIGDLYSGKARERWLSSQTAVASVSALLFLALGGLLGRQGWQAPFLVYGLAWPMALGVLLLVREPAGQGEGGHVARIRMLDWSGLPGRHMALSCGTTVLAAILFYTIQVNISTVLPAHGVTDPGQIGLFSALASIGVPLGTLVFWRLARLDVRLLLAGEFSLIAAAFIAMGLAGNAGLFIGFAFVGQLAAGMLLPTLLTWALSVLNFTVRGRGTGLWQSSFSIGQFLSALVVPALTLATGSVAAALPVIGLGALLVAAVNLFLLLQNRSVSAS
ncbi:MULTISPECIES: MFS transporter [unclassified Azospirillum]|uniref:MFS transporter n=1 Tax=unclassified Azospirillum TaxID=2630922 RepID=UPI000B625CE6|nr:MULTISPECIES: MFS transporter [unclassified Azospirillum]SNS52036.1 Predicted arabinose efflux permease, MFS family [Azospirillum sp. RU38E]SNS69464.1 Predicted arabinose efflux permease, MFS family [Azospirillum sp. RU37A]